MSAKSFIVTLKEATEPSAFKQLVSSIGGTVTHEFSLIKGFTINVPETQFSTVKQWEGVASIEEDSEVKIL